MRLFIPFLGRGLSVKVVSKLYMAHLLCSIYLCACMRTVVYFFQNTSQSIDMLLIRMDRQGTWCCLLPGLLAVWCSVVIGILQLRAEFVSVVCINTERIQPAVWCCRFCSILAGPLTWDEVHILLLRYSSVFRHQESLMIDVVRCSILRIWVHPYCLAIAFGPCVLTYYFDNPLFLIHRNSCTVFLVFCLAMLPVARTKLRRWKRVESERIRA